MPAPRDILFALLLFLTLSGPVAAGCGDLEQAVDLAERNLAPGQVSNASELTVLNRVITGLNNDELLRVLQRGGQASAFGDLRNFLTQLKFLSAPTNGLSFEFTPQMQQDLVFARDLLQLVCADGHDAGGDMSVASQESDGSTGTVSGAIRQWWGNQTLFNRTAIASLQEEARMHMLAQLIGLLALATLVVITAQYAIVSYRLLQRKRRLCKIPADLICMMTETPGNIAMLERTGCSFTPTPGLHAEALRAISGGTYCAIWVNETSFGVRLMGQEDGTVSLLFLEPLSESKRAMLLDESITPPRMDFSPLRARKLRPVRIGPRDTP